ncbi:hypothetical protein F5Y17DRAFT_304234 [Xylariaceae sp. FL0594]|nr:hypothetical protein F5Y17DRAFT_304234 [Xylariaceae sp. FL0594]
MEDSGGAPDGDSSSEPNHHGSSPEVIVISPQGDVVLDATFQNSKETIRSANKAARAKHTSLRNPQPQQPAPKPRARLAFRVDLAVLKTQSKYFEKLLGDSHFKETKDIADAFSALSLKNLKPKDAGVEDLPWVKIHDDDEAASYAYRENVFADLLRILHGQDVQTSQPPITMSFVTTLAVFADRFDCTASVSRYVSTKLKFKWPVTNLRKPRDDGSSSFSTMSRANENVLRQKILVSWLLNQPGKFQAATRELIMNGSCRWSSFGEEDDETSTGATWWFLQDGLEQELQYRRNCILNTIASVPRHFLTLYAASPGIYQCKLGFDSSLSCDTYQLGQMFKFLTKKGLLYLVDFSPGSLYSVADTSLLPVDSLIDILAQCPSYQIDNHHTNCGLRTRMLPILEFIKGLLSANSIPISSAAWRSNRSEHAWMPAEHGETDGKGHHEDDSKPFRFTRSLAIDARVRFENTMGAEKLARNVFTATSWDWTAEDQLPDRASTTPRLFLR